MKTKLKDKNLTSWDDHLDKKYGKRGSNTHEKNEEDFETFKIGILIQEARKRQHMTQEELAIRVGTTKNRHCSGYKITDCYILERYASTEAAMNHMKLFQEEFAEKFNGVVEMTGFTLYGKPGPELINALGAAAENSRVLVAGFAR